MGLLNFFAEAVAFASAAQEHEAAGSADADSGSHGSSMDAAPETFGCDFTDAFGTACPLQAVAEAYDASPSQDWSQERYDHGSSSWE